MRFSVPRASCFCVSPITRPDLSRVRGRRVSGEQRGAARKRHARIESLLKDVVEDVELVGARRIHGVERECCG